MKAVLLLAIWLLQLKPVRAQGGNDGLAWGIAGVDWASDSAHWRVETTYQRIWYQQASRYFLSLGSLHVTRQLTRRGLSLTAGCVLGDLDQLGSASVVQGRLRQTWKQPGYTLFGQLTADRLRTQSRPGPDAPRQSIYRIRAQFSVERPVNKTVTASVYTEPFIRRGDTWLREVRSQAGVRWSVRKAVRLGVFYFNRWACFPNARVTWEHYGVAELTVPLHKSKTGGL